MAYGRRARLAFALVSALGAGCASPTDVDLIGLDSVEPSRVELGDR